MTENVWKTNTNWGWQFKEERQGLEKNLAVELFIQTGETTKNYMHTVNITTQVMKKTGA